MPDEVKPPLPEGATTTSTLNIPAQQIDVPEQALRIEVTAVPKGEGNIAMPVDGPTPTPTPPPAPSPPPEAAPTPPPAPAPAVVFITPEAYVNQQVAALAHVNEVAQRGIVQKHDADMVAIRVLLDEREKNRDAITAEKDKAITLLDATKTEQTRTALDSLNGRLTEMNDLRRQLEAERQLYLTKEAFNLALTGLNKQVEQQFSTMTTRLESILAEMRQADDRVRLAGSDAADVIRARLTEVESVTKEKTGATTAMKELRATIFSAVGLIATILAIAATIIALSSRLH